MVSTQTSVGDESAVGQTGTYTVLSHHDLEGETKGFGFYDMTHHLSLRQHNPALMPMSPNSNLKVWHWRGDHLGPLL